VTTGSLRQADPVLPVSRGPLSAAVLAGLRGAASRMPSVDHIDPYDDDLHLALYCCYELHYRGFAGVDDGCEWDPALLAVRAELERAFLRGLRRDIVPGTDVAAEVDALLVEPVDAAGVSHHLRRDGELWQLREYVAHRSIYHLKEADPQSFVIARLEGPAKAALVSVEHDEYGAGDPDRMHSRLFANMMIELGLSDDYGAYRAPTRRRHRVWHPRQHIARESSGRSTPRPLEKREDQPPTATPTQCGSVACAIPEASHLRHDNDAELAQLPPAGVVGCCHRNPTEASRVGWSSSTCASPGAGSVQ